MVGTQYSLLIILYNTQFRQNFLKSSEMLARNSVTSFLKKYDLQVVIWGKVLRLSRILFVFLCH